MTCSEKLINQLFIHNAEIISESILVIDSIIASEESENFTENTWITT